MRCCGYFYLCMLHMFTCSAQGILCMSLNFVFSCISGSVYTGVDFCKKLCGVSIVRRWALNQVLVFRSYNYVEMRPLYLNIWVIVSVTILFCRIVMNPNLSLLFWVLWKIIKILLILYICWSLVYVCQQCFLVWYVSGESMENALRACCKGIKIGKILIHRDGDNGKQVTLCLWNRNNFTKN